METTTIAGVKVSRVGLGTWALGGLDWGAVPDDVAVSTCLGALERGINLIDTAPIYGHGHAEEVVGKAIRAHGRREDFFIATKTGLQWDERGVFTNSTAPRLRQELEDSLRRLGTDFIDLYQVHWPDPLVPIPETAALLDGFRREGKVRALGVSNFSVTQMAEFSAAAPLASCQPPYNLFERQIECGACGENLLFWCAAHEVAVLTWSTLCRSLLGGRVTRETKFDAGDIRSADPKFQPPRFGQYLAALERLAAFAHDRYGKTLPQLAVRWVLDRIGVSVALWGARRPDQLDAVAGAVGWELDTATMAEIDRIVNEAIPDPIGPEYLAPKVREIPPPLDTPAA
jgi:aryl-alcohol dehydrogenase-like predicted oxidoreductase